MGYSIKGHAKNWNAFFWTFKRCNPENLLAMRLKNITKALQNIIGHFKSLLDQITHQS